jgi:AcrR family transcriptional regulator
VSYQRFKDKRAFFDALQFDFVQRGRENWQAFFDRADREWSARELLEQLVAGSARTISCNIGFFRAMLALGHHDKRAVEPVVDMDLFAAARLEEHLVAHKMISRRKLRNGQVYFGLSAVTRAVVIMSANDVGPFRAMDRRTRMEFAEMLGRYLGLDLD